jgi:hypothetical protein
MRGRDASDLPGLRQPLHTVLPDRLEHAIPGLGCLDYLEQRLVNQAASVSAKAVAVLGCRQPELVEADDGGRRERGLRDVCRPSRARRSNRRASTASGGRSRR